MASETTKKWASSGVTTLLILADRLLDKLVQIAGINADLPGLLYRVQRMLNDMAGSGSFEIIRWVLLVALLTGIWGVPWILNNRKNPQSKIILPEAFEAAAPTFRLLNWLSSNAIKIAFLFIFVALCIGLVCYWPTGGLEIDQNSGQLGEQTQPTSAASVTQTGIKLTAIPKGSFQMGSSGYAPPDQKPQHEVALSEFLLGVYEVTEREFAEVMDEIDSNVASSEVEYPMVSVTWFEAIRFCNALSQIEGVPPYYEIIETEANGIVETRVIITDQFATGYRLPTEAEWEYACRAGSETKYSFGDDVTMLDEYAWYANNAPNEKQPIGKKLPNDWGLYDMHGNVYEWCWDWYSQDYYQESPRNNPTGPAEPQLLRICRGGSWGGGGEHTDSGPHIAEYCQSAHRGHSQKPADAFANLGFRIARFTRTPDDK